MGWERVLERLFQIYYDIKFFPFRKERQERLAEGRQRGFVGIQIDGLSAPHLRQALERGYLPNLARLLERGHVLRDYRAGLPSTTPAAQGAIFYGIEHRVPAFRWYEKASGQLISCNDPDQVQHFRERLFGGETGVLAGGSSYSNILDGDAARSIFTVSSPHPQTLFGRFGGFRFLLLMLLHPLRVCRMGFATVIEYFTNLHDRRQYRRTRPWPLKEGLFPFIRIFCNVILRELQTFGVIADIYSGVPRIYTTYSGYDELGHHFGPGSRPALKNLKYTDQRIGEILRMLRHAPAADYQLVILSDHGQTPGYPFQARFGATLGESISAFLRKKAQAAVSSGPLDFMRVQLDYLSDELGARPGGWRQRLYHLTKSAMQRRIRQLVPETMKVDAEGGIVVTYSSSLAHLYITGVPRRLTLEEAEELQPLLVRFLSQHKGIGFVMARGAGETLWALHAEGRTAGSASAPPPPAELEFLRPYGDPRSLWPELCRFAGAELCGDLVLFGDYNGERIACFDEQVGGHGSVGGEQLKPFLVLPAGHPLLAERELSGHAFLYHRVFRPLAGDA